MSGEATAPFAFQLEVATMLLDYHLTELSVPDLLWVPAPVHWTMHDTGSGWDPDFSETEPDPVPVPTIGWLTWHLQWWWSCALADVRGGPAPGRTDLDWRPEPDQIRGSLAELRSAWSEVLATATAADLDRPSGYPWPSDAGRSRRDQFAWLAVEHTKNVSEIGQLMMLRRAGSSQGRS